MPIADAENTDLALISFSVLVARNPRSSKIPWVCEHF
jgi:hypothetical protein